MLASRKQDQHGNRPPRGLPIAVLLVGSVVGLVLVAVVAVFAAGYTVARRNTDVLIRDKAELVVGSIIERTHLHLEPARAQLDYLGRLIAEGRIDLDDDASLAQHLLTSLAAAPQVSVVAFVDPEMQVLRAFRNRPGRRIARDDWSDSAYFRRVAAEVAAADGAYWGELYVAEDIGRTYINIRMPVLRDGRFAGALIAGVSIADLSEFLGGLDGAPAENAFILSDRRFVLAHPRLRDGYADARDLKPLPLLDEVGDPVLAAIWQPRRANGINADPADRFEARAIDHAGDTYLFLFRELADYGKEPWLVGTYAPLADSAAQVARLGLIPRVGLGVLAAALLVALLLGHALSRPVRDLAQAAARIRRLDLAELPRLPRGPFRELNQAAAAFEAMVGGLHWFETYVPRSLVRRLMRRQDAAAVESEEREVTVLFTDIADFTAFAENQPASAVAAFLNEHFTLVDRCVEAEGGTVDKYMGDALMAFWGAPESQPDHAERACRAAQGIAAAIEQDNKRRRAAGLAPVRLHMGIHSGPVVVGNIGAPGRINYTIIGDAVNITERLEGLARELSGGRGAVAALASAATVGRLGPDHGLASCGEHLLRGRHGPIEAYWLQGGPPAAQVPKAGGR